MGLLGTVGGMKQGRATMDFQIKRIFRFIVDNAPTVD